MFFCFYQCADNRDLHSFPTRRSSDLRLLQRPFGGTSLGTGLVALGRRGGDRKSTRLNSSHTVISYAVFCLKKKNLFAITSNRANIITTPRSIRSQRVRHAPLPSRPH